MDIGFKNDRFKSVKFSGKIWRMVFSSQGLIVDQREKGEVQWVYLSSHFEVKTLDHIQVTWMSDLEMFDGEHIFLKSYPNSNDPSALQKHKVSLISGLFEQVEDFPVSSIVMDYPHQIMPDSAYYPAICELLGKDLVHMVEYLEVGSKSVVSYYLANHENKLLYDRYVAVAEGQKILIDLRQDMGMKGPTPDAFCIFENEIFFIRNTHEICSYRL